MMNFKLQNSLLFLVCFFLAASVIGVESSLPEKKLVVLITSYNNQRWVVKNLMSVASQKYSNYRVIYVNDCSTDDTDKLVEDFSKKFPKLIDFKYIKNEKRVGALANIYYAVHSCEDDEVVVSLDGDDWFASSTVLQQINSAYSTQDIWLTHGSLIEYPNESSLWSIPIPSEVINSHSFRKYRCPSHLRTFYTWLFKLIQQDDLLYEGQFCPMAWDQAMMFPMIEMAGERHLFMTQILYVYNVANAINDNKVNQQLQNDIEAYIRAKTPYQRLDTRPLQN